MADQDDKAWDEEYDVIVLGTGLKECILSGMLSVNKLKVLHMDRNDYYGAESASLNLEKMWEKFEPKKDDEKKSEEKEDGKKKKPDIPKNLGSARGYSIDMAPKFIMANGDMVKMLISTKVTRYLDFKVVEGSYVYKEGKLNDVPVTPKMVWDSKLMGIFQKRRFKNFLQWALDTDSKNQKTWDKLDLSVDKEGKCKTTMDAVYSYWCLDDYTMQFTGHAIALYSSDHYLKNPKETWPCLDRIKLYAYSLARYSKSPYIYPMWGLGGLPEGFSRLAAVHGGTYMLRRPITKINYGEDGKVTSVDCEVKDENTKKVVSKRGKLKKGGLLLGDPSYFLDTLKAEKPLIKKLPIMVARWFCIMTEEAAAKIIPKRSAQIILSAKETKRNYDTYISKMTQDLNVTPKGFCIMSISSNVESKTEDKQKQELGAARALIGKDVLKEFFFANDFYVPCNNPKNDNTFICSSPDATTHFATATAEVMRVYRLMTGKKVDLSAKPEDAFKDE